jgi:gliding motility-associated-like protein
VLLSQKILSGNLNQPATHVTNIPASDRVIVDDATNFASNDTILLIQMQGVEILTGALDYGNINGFFGQPGMHEFMIIQSVNYLTQEIVFRNNLLKTYDTRGNIQIVRVAFYNSVVVTGPLTCNPWNSTTKNGGVLALIVGRSLKLNADIDVSSKGFIGGNDIAGEGRCQLVAPLTSNKTYPLSFLNAGFKGEGIAIHDFSGVLLAPNNVKGNGPNFTGGGGGNGRFSGGGGGSNRGAGGIGGYESNACTAPQAGGLGGIKSESPSFPSLVDRIYLGGGGGASTSLTGLSQPGGNGGGIVIIVTDTIIGNSHKIISNGSNGGTAVANGGSGGGGAGGSVALSVTSYGSTPLTISISGGNGGDNPDIFGEGGGGGGGLFYYLTPPSANVQIFKDGGTQGNFSNPPTNPGLPGETGDTKPGFKAILNGFLFNSISSSVTGNQIDSVCSNMIPPKINGTIPVGGTGPYIYKWEKSYDQSAWTTLVNDPDPTNYIPSVVETATVWFRRTITDNSPTPLVDISKSVKIIVQPFIKNNIVGNSDTICFAQNPPAFTSKATLQDGNGKYSFNWEVSLNNSLYANPANSHNTEGYTPLPALTQTSWYRRTVTSGRCIDSTAIVKITVLDTVKNNKILNSPPDICYGMTFTNLSATTPATTPALSGGDNSYIFKWQSNINGTGWGTAPGVSNGAGYNPVELAQRIPSNQYIYRRVVYSGSNNVCVSTSDSVIVKDFPVITNNSIAPVPPICFGTVPANIIGSKPPTLSGGNTIYNYNWQDSSKFHTWTLISGATGADYQPPILTDTTSYRRSVLSPDISTGCFDISNSIKIIVHKPILNNSISVSGGGTTETICNNQQPGTFQGTIATGGTGIAGSYVYQWKFSFDNSVFTPVATAGAGVNYSPPQLTATTYYQRQVTSGACIVNSNSITETVLPAITNNTISGNPKVCYSLVPDAITGATLSGGSGTYKYFWWQSTDGGAIWMAASGTNTSSAYQPPALFNAIKFERTVTSGLNDCCTSTSNVFDIGIDPLPASPINAGHDTIIYSIEKIYHMNAIKPLTGETGVWDVLDNGTSSIDDTTKYNTTVRNLSIGNNSFLWTVNRGLCKLSDSVTIELLKDFIPQGFSPNGDAYNNTFIIEGLNLDDNYADLSIVNGAGTEVFKTSNRDNQKWSDWDGKNSRGLDLSEGTYYYMLKVTSKQSNGPVFKKSGFIVLKRY